MEIVNANVNIVPISTDTIMHDHESIIDSYKFRVFYKAYRFFVKVELIDVDEDDSYSIVIHDQSKESDRFKFDLDNEICNCVLDSSGGGIVDESITVVPLNSNDFKPLEDVEIAINDHLFGNIKKGITGVITQF